MENFKDLFYERMEESFEEELSEKEILSEFSSSLEQMKSELFAIDGWNEIEMADMEPQAHEDESSQ